MKEESLEPEIVDLASYREKRNKNKPNSEIITDVHLSVTRDGQIVPGRIKVADLHVLSVLMWGLELSTNMLAAYLRKSP